jgi:hypothetical protein
MLASNNVRVIRRSEDLVNAEFQALAHLIHRTRRPHSHYE